jgi:putative endonuclease
MINQAYQILRSHRIRRVHARKQLDMLMAVTDPRMQRGLDCETLAVSHLRECGVEVLARNLRCKSGELDIVARENNVLLIVEVRQRARKDFGGALGSVTWRKRRNIMRATRYFLQANREWRLHSLRFDVIAVEGTPDGTHQINWVRDAFRAR